MKLTNLCMLMILLSAPMTASSDDRPNILLIMADDLGFSDLGCFGSEIETPNLDALAAGGLRMNQFYNTAKCHSSRICLLTGLYMFQAGNEQMNRGVTIAEALNPAGYHTMMVGKWHLKQEPTDRGFQRYFGHLSGATNFFTGDDTFRLNGQPYQVPDDGFYTTDVKTDYALKFLKESEAKDQPFFLYVAYNAPHYPLHVKESDFRKYQHRYSDGWDKIRQQRYKKQSELGLFEDQPALSQRPPEVPGWNTLSQDQKLWESERMAAFAGMVDSLDQNIGRIIDYLKKTKQFDNTLIMFCSDNGACPFERTRGQEKRPWDSESYWTYDVGWAHVGNTPFRWYKQNQHEGGITSPFIASWPKGINATPGSIDSQPAHLIDLMATSIDLANARYPEQFENRDIEPLQGKSLLPILKGEQRVPHEWLYFQFGNNRALRQGNMKAVSARGGRWELYDLNNDRSETHDLADSHQEEVKSLADLWHDVAENIEHAPGKLRKPVTKKTLEKYPSRK